MSVTIKWQPRGNGKALKSSLSSVVQTLAKAFGEHPWELGREHLPVLQGMSAGWRGEDDPYQDLIDAIDQHGSVRVWAEY